ncbi:MAG: P1 family peptidase [Acidobacteria bacterium]|nr:P1 family peptidase [Acidobacteriota bacterium]MBI3280301.1 P1 family peptidase [Acidobacteriota bacterium]
MKGLTDIPGIEVGHASDYEGITGCTAIVCAAGAVAGVDVRGFATGTQELDLLDPLHLTPHIHALVFAGGSAFGLEAASGVRRFLEQKGIGFPFGGARVPLVPCAILFDLGIGKAKARPTREMGEVAAAAANGGPVAEGSVGAGTGATVGKVFGLRQAVKGGIGTYTVTLERGVKVSALAAVNAFGDVIDPASGSIVAGARTSPSARQFANTGEVLKRGRRRSSGENTTLVAVATNVRLDKVGATRLARMAQLGMVRAISPVHTTVDGDVVFALSAGSEEADLNALGVAAAEAVAAAIVRAVKKAKTLGGIPAAA